MRVFALFACFSAAALFAQDAAKETALGRHMIQELGRTSKIIETPEQVIAMAQSLSPQRAIEVKLIESNEALANVFPGGIVYISTAALHNTTRAELAAILAHQIAHVTLHPQRVEAGNVATIPLMFLGGPGGMCTRFGKEKVLIPMSLVSRQESIEEEASLLGKGYLEQAGYEAIELKPLFDRLNHPTPVPRKAPTLLR